MARYQQLFLGHFLAIGTVFSAYFLLKTLGKPGAFFTACLLYIGGHLLEVSFIISNYSEYENGDSYILRTGVVTLLLSPIVLLLILVL